MSNFISKHKGIIFICFAIVLCILFFLFLPLALSNNYKINNNTASVVEVTATTSIPIFIPTYVETPEAVKGVYITSWTASSVGLRSGIVKLIDETELNTIVIDIKDYTGKIIFPVENDELKSYGSVSVRVSDMRDFIESLHKKGIYVIGRVAVFQDEYFVNYRPDLAVKNKAGTEVWKDRKGISWIDAGSQEYWDYIILLAKESRKIGFDEINFDYIRFPSDGDMKNISYPFSSSTPKSKVLRNFFEYLDLGLEDSGLKTSADLFGMVTTVKDDMGIGQILEDAFPYFDYISPMVYPSHYPPNFEGFKNPEAHPYQIISIAMKSAVDRAILASTSPSKLRPWLQDFGLKMKYGPDEVKSQIRATNDVGLNSWLLWSASNKYTKSALIPEY